MSIEKILRNNEFCHFDKLIFTCGMGAPPVPADIETQAPHLLQVAKTADSIRNEAYVPGLISTTNRGTPPICTCEAHCDRCTGGGFEETRTGAEFKIRALENHINFICNHVFIRNSQKFPQRIQYCFKK
mmetsp:Transcript_33207/g.76577  ORF Transcript_33207/g.76577 Transcript_33207/m.76577 type:complete len:129 (-) Transcript_33207:710-1096(-)